MSIDNGQLDLMAHILSASARRHEVIAGNLANLNVPNFRARQFKFEESFRTALSEGGKDQAMNVNGEVVIDKDAAVKADGNSVHMEREVEAMQKNRLMYGLFSNLMQHKIGTLRRAIKGTS